GPAPPPVVEEGVDGLLQHALLVVDDDLGRAEVEQPLQPVVAVDHAAVEVVEVGRGEAATVELHHRAQVGRDHRHRVEDHGARVVDPAAVLVASVERGDDLQPLDGLLLALGGQRPPSLFGIDGGAELDLLLVEVDLVDELGDGVRAHAAPEVLAVAIAQLPPQHLVLEDLAGEEVAELVVGALGDVALGLGRLADLARLLLPRPLARVDLGRLGAFGLERLDLLLDLLAPAREPHLEVVVDRLQLLAQLDLEVGEVGVAPLVVDPRDEIGGEVDDLLELLGLQLLTGLRAHEEVGQPRARSAQVPDVHHGRGQLDVAHALAPDLGPRDLDPAALADDALEPDALVLAAVALPVLGRTEDLLAEETVLLGLERAVVDRLRLLHLAVRPRADRVRRGQPDPKLIKVVDVQHVYLSPQTKRTSRVGVAPSAATCCGWPVGRAPDGRGPRVSGEGPIREGP